MSSSPRRPLVVANWKMHKSLAEAEAFVPALAAALDGAVPGGVEVVVAPAFPHLVPLAVRLRPLGYKLGGQNCHGAAQGAFTGEVSAAMLRDAGASWVILGHSERRRLAGESDRDVRAKLAAAAGAGLAAIVCIGETLEEREAGRTREVLDRQLGGALGSEAGRAALTPRGEGLAVAYEPVWAIGTGRNATAAQVGEALQGIRQRLAVLLGAGAAEATRLLYGGSVNSANAAEILSPAEADGALVGGASLDPVAFAAIIAAVARRGAPRV